ncbi:MAG: AraC family transcriptional regulator [Magnetovibrionaceae bacterium]
MISPNGQIPVDVPLDPAGDTDTGQAAIIVRRRIRQAAYVVDWHRHRRHQLVYAAKGTLLVETPTGHWVVPPARAVWMPSETPHKVTARGAVEMRNVYLDPDQWDDLPQACLVVEVSALLREILSELADRTGTGEAPLADLPTRNLWRVMADQIKGAPTASLHLPLSNERRLKPILDALVASPGDRRTLADWASASAASERTLARLFTRETGLNFREWRTRARLLSALDQLGRGNSVAEVAYDLGYDSPSAFIARFREELGKTPKRYFE